MNNKEDARKTIKQLTENVNNHIISLKRDVNNINVSTLRRVKRYYSKNNSTITQIDIIDFGETIDNIINEIQRDISINHEKSIYNSIESSKKEVTKDIDSFVKDYISVYNELKDMCSLNYYKEISKLSKYKNNENYEIIKGNIKKCILYKQLKSNAYKTYLINFLKFVRNNLKNSVNEEGEK